MKRFYIIRHGKKVSQQLNPPLSELGNIQAQKTAKFLKDFPISKIIASPMLRTQQTAQYIASLLETQYATHELLKERLDWEDDSSLSMNDFLNIWTKASKDREWQPPIGDSSINSGRRLEKVIGEFVEANFDHVVLVTHGGIIGDFLRNLFTYKELNQFVDDYELTIDSNIHECSITVVDINADKKFKLVKLASIDHLLS